MTYHTITKTTTEHGLIVEQETVKLEWRKEAPTEPGWYKLRKNQEARSTFIQLDDYFGELRAYAYGKTIGLSDFSGWEWLGPFPAMDGEK